MHHGGKPVAAMEKFFPEPQKYTGLPGHSLITLHKRMRAAIEQQLRQEGQRNPPDAMRLKCADLALDFVNIALAMDSPAHKMAEDDLLSKWRSKGREWDAQTPDPRERPLGQFYETVMCPDLNRVFGGMNSADKAAYETLSMHVGPGGERYDHGKPSLFLLRLWQYRSVLGNYDTDEVFFEKAVRALPTCLRKQLGDSKYQHVDIRDRKLNLESFKRFADKVFEEALAEASSTDASSFKKYGTEAEAREEAAGRFPYVPLVLYPQGSAAQAGGKGRGDAQGQHGAGGGSGSGSGSGAGSGSGSSRGTGGGQQGVDKGAVRPSGLTPLARSTHARGLQPRTPTGSATGIASRMQHSGMEEVSQQGAGQHHLPQPARGTGPASTAGRWDISSGSAPTLGRGRGVSSSARQQHQEGSSSVLLQQQGGSSSAHQHLRQQPRAGAGSSSTKGASPNALLPSGRWTRFLGTSYLSTGTSPSHTGPQQSSPIKTRRGSGHRSVVGSQHSSSILRRQPRPWRPNCATALRTSAARGH